MNKKEWFEELIARHEKKDKAAKSKNSADKRLRRAVDNYITLTNNIPNSVDEGNYKYKGYLIEIDQFDDVEIVAEPDYKKI